MLPETPQNTCEQHQCRGQIRFKHGRRRFSPDQSLAYHLLVVEAEISLEAFSARLRMGTYCNRANRDGCIYLIFVHLVFPEQEGFCWRRLPKYGAAECFNNWYRWTHCHGKSNIIKAPINDPDHCPKKSKGMTVDTGFTGWTSFRGKSRHC